MPCCPHTHSSPPRRDRKASAQSQAYSACPSHFPCPPTPWSEQPGRSIVWISSFMLSAFLCLCQTSHSTPVPWFSFTFRSPVHLSVHKDHLFETLNSGVTVSRNSTFAPSFPDCELSALQRGIRSRNWCLRDSPRCQDFSESLICLLVFTGVGKVLLCPIYRAVMLVPDRLLPWVCSSSLPRMAVMLRGFFSH